MGNCDFILPMHLFHLSLPCGTWWKELGVITSQAAHTDVCPDAEVFCTSLKDWLIVDVKGLPYKKLKETHVQPWSTFKSFRKDLDWILEKKSVSLPALCFFSGISPPLSIYSSFLLTGFMSLIQWTQKTVDFPPRNRVFFFVCKECGSWVWNASIILC